MSVWTDNPVLRKEIATRLSLRRQSRVNRIAVAALCAVVVPLLYWFTGRALLQPQMSPREAIDTYGIFVVGIETGLLTLMAPTLAAGAITIEREKQTWNALLLSRLRPAEIVLGKYVGSLLPVAVVLGIFLPINVVAALRADMSLSRFVLSHAVLIATGLLFGAIGLFCSWACRRTQVATSVATLLVALVVLGSALAFVLWEAIAGYGGSTPAESFLPLWGNPFYVQVTLFDEREAQRTTASGIATAYLVGAAFTTALLLKIATARLDEGPREMTP